MDHFDFAYKEMKQSEGVDSDAIVALVVAPNDYSHDFVVTVSNNAGYNITLFRDDMEGAIKYLQEYKVDK